MSGIVKTIIIGASITIGVLFLTLFGLYKIMGNKDLENDLSQSDTATYEENTLEKAINIYKESIKDEDTNTSISNNLITIYMFKGNGCPHCENATEYFESIKDELENIEIITYEVWYNSNNRDLMKKVADKLDINVSGVPFFVIGDYTSSGFGNGDKLIDKARELSEDKDYKDIVKEVLEDSNIDVESEKITS